MIAGHIVNELGEPIERVNVDVMPVQYEAGRRRLASAGAISSLTDDLGRYRIDGLKPGRYIVTAVAHGDQSRFVRNEISGSNGGFVIAGLPFGTYYIAALGRLPLDGDEAWRDPALLDALVRRAATVVVRDGQRETVRVRTGER